MIVVPSPEEEEHETDIERQKSTICPESDAQDFEVELDSLASRLDKALEMTIVDFSERLDNLEREIEKHNDADIQQVLSSLSKRRNHFVEALSKTIRSLTSEAMYSTAKILSRLSQSIDENYERLSRDVHHIRKKNEKRIAISRFAHHIDKVNTISLDKAISLDQRMKEKLQDFKEYENLKNCLCLVKSELERSEASRRVADNQLIATEDNAFCLENKLAEERDKVKELKCIIKDKDELISVRRRELSENRKRQECSDKQILELAAMLKMTEYKLKQKKKKEEKLKKRVDTLETLHAQKETKQFQAHDTVVNHGHYFQSPKQINDQSWHVPPKSKKYEREIQRDGNHKTGVNEKKNEKVNIAIESLKKKDEEKHGKKAQEEVDDTTITIQLQCEKIEELERYLEQKKAQLARTSATLTLCTKQKEIRDKLLNSKNIGLILSADRRCDLPIFDDLISGQSMRIIAEQNTMNGTPSNFLPQHHRTSDSISEYSEKRQRWREMRSECLASSLSSPRCSSPALHQNNLLRDEGRMALSSSSHFFSRPLLRRRYNNNVGNNDGNRKSSSVEAVIRHRRENRSL